MLIFATLLLPGNGALDGTNFHAAITMCYTPKGCVFRTIFGEESSVNNDEIIANAAVDKSIADGIDWIVKSQLSDGGWGAGSHARQDIIDPHAVAADPATTAMVTMALLRTGTRLNGGKHSASLKNALSFLLDAVSTSGNESVKITALTNTQIQTKLGQHIDLILTIQCLSNIIDHIEDDLPLRQRVEAALNSCVSKVSLIQNQDGSIKGAGWAGVLQSALANNALESASFKGIAVDKDVLANARSYQKSNYDASSGNVNTEKGAGIVLYSVTGSARASAKQARRVREEITRAKKEGKIANDAKITDNLLEQIGFEEAEAEEYYQSYQVYESAKDKAQEEKVLDGFGNNGGEEFLSYLQTGESLIINQDKSWIDWYEKMATRLVGIQNQDGSWNGHHCITSPVFCTATTLLTLSIDNDIESLTAMGKE